MPAEQADGWYWTDICAFIVKYLHLGEFNSERRHEKLPLAIFFFSNRPYVLLSFFRILMFICNILFPCLKTAL